MGELPEQAGLPDAGLPDDRDDLAVAGLGLRQGVAERLDLLLSAHEARETRGPRRACRRERTGPDPEEPRKTSIGALQPLDAIGPSGLTWT